MLIPVKFSALVSLVLINRSVGENGLNFKREPEKFYWEKEALKALKRANRTVSCESKYL